MPRLVKRHFTNPFPDYSPENAVNRISVNHIDKNSKISLGLNAKWEKTLEAFTSLDPSDYSVYTGTSGVALLRLLKDAEDRTNLLEVKKLLRLNYLKNKRHTFLCGDAGPLAIGAVVTYKLGEDSECKKIVKDLLSLQAAAINYKSDLPNEYLYGRAGYLFALLYVNKNVSPPPVEDTVIRKVIEAIFECGKCEAASGKFKSPLMYQWHDSYYLGAAHGVSGIIYLLLQAHQYLTDSELNVLVKPTVDYLTTLQFPSGNFPSSLGSDTDKYVQWCHGSPGFLYMYSQAYKIFRDEKYLKLALQNGDVIWERGILKKGYSICHGVSGNAYCFLELYQTTKDIRHLYRAIRFAEWCIDYTRDHEEYPPDRPLSLFEGIAGPMYLLLDIQKPMNAKFPGFTL